MMSFRLLYAILVLILLKQLKAISVGLVNSTTTPDNTTNHTIHSSLFDLAPLVEKKRLEQRNFFKDIDYTGDTTTTTNNDNNVFSLEFNLQIDSFLSFEASDAYAELITRLKFKWWNRKISPTVNSTISYQPVIFFKDAHNSLTNNQPRSLTGPTVFDYHYAALERNITFRFKCNANQDYLDTSQFPFDTHTCHLDLFIDLEPVGHRKLTKTSSYNPTLSRPRLSVINKLNVDNNVKRVSGDWLLQKLSVSAWNSTSEAYMSRIQLRFFITRRYEPHLYLLVLPLAIFTCLTFVVFWLPTTNTSEKTLLTLVNLTCLLLFNVHLFKLTMSTMGFVHAPQLLQYSSCLMVVQLMVFGYICLAKSVYHYGLFNLNTEQLSTARSGKNNFVRHMNDYGGGDEDEQRLQQQVEFVRLGNKLEKRNGGSTGEKFDITIQQADTKRCRCNSMETDADCLNITDDSLNNNINKASTTKSKTSRTVKAAKHETKNKKPHIEIRQQKIIITNLDSENKESFQCINGNWILTQPNTKQIKPGYPYPCCVKSGTINSLPEYDSTSHLTRVVKKTDNECGCCPVSSSTFKQPEDEKSARNLFFNKQAETEVYNEINSRDTGELWRSLERYLQIQSGVMSRGWLGVGRLNASVDRLVELDEMDARERLLRNRWKRNSRWLDGICFVIVSGTLFICCVLIFFVFPVLKINLFFQN